MHIKGNKNQNFTVSPPELYDYFKTNVLKYYGDFGMASVGNLSVKYCDPESKLLIIRVSHGPHRFLTSILPLLTVVSFSKLNLPFQLILKSLPILGW